MSFFFLLILLFILWPLIRVLYAVNKARRQARDFFNQSRGHRGGFYSDPYDEPERPGGWSRGNSVVRPKVFTRDIGEYVEFEEIEGTSANDGYTYTRTTYSAESFISDADWEDIK